MPLQFKNIAVGNLQDDVSGNNYAANKAVYILNLNNTLAQIFSDEAGTTPIVQDGVNNVTGARGVFGFWVEAGDYFVQVGANKYRVSITGADYFNNRVDETVNLIVDSVAGRGAYYPVGSFEAGFTYTDINQVGTFGGTDYYIYTGGLTNLPHSVTAGTNPTLSSDYTKVFYGEIDNVQGLRDELNDRALYLTLTEAQAKADLVVDQYVRLTDYGRGLWVVVPNSDVGGYYIQMASNKLKLQYEDVINLDWIDLLPSDSPAATTTKMNAVAGILSEGMTLTTGKGAYILAGSVTFPSKRIRLNLGNSEFTQTTEYTSTFIISDADGVKISGGKFFGLGTEHNGASTSWNNVAAIYLNTPVNAYISGVKAYNHAGGSFRYKDANGLVFKRCIAEGIGSEGGIATLDNNGDFAIGSFSSTSDNKVKVQMCDISKHCFGVGASRGESLQVTNSDIYDIPGQHGIYASAMSKMLVAGCNFTNIAGEGVKSQIATDNTDIRSCIVKDSTFTDIGQTPIVIGRTTNVGNSYAYSVNIDGNVIRNAGNYFISLRDCYGVIGDTNDMQGAVVGYGLFLDGFGGRIGKSVIASTGWCGIWLEMLANVEVDFRLTDCCKGATGSGLDLTTYMYVTAQGGVTNTPVLTLSSGSFNNQETLPSSVTTCIRTSSSVEVASKGFDNNIGKSWRFDNVSQLDTNISEGADFTVSATRDPLTPIYGRGRRVMYGTQDPASAGMTDKFIKGDICYRSDYDGTGVFMWVCTTDGTPGTWTARV